MNNNKTMKKMVATGVLAAMTMSAAAVPAFAADPKITAPGNEGHTYKIYQVFTGNVNTDTKTIENAQWGADGKEAQSGVVSADVLNALKDVSKNESEAARLHEIKQHANIDGSPNKYAAVLNPKDEVEVEPGYYVIEDIVVVDGKAKSSYVTVLVGGDTVIQPKSSVVTVDKQVSDEAGDQTTNKDSIYDNNVGNTGNVTDLGAGEVWSESADHEIGEKFKFRLTAQLPDEAQLKTYKNYYLRFNDTLSEGVTFDGTDVVRYSTDGGNTWKTFDDSAYTFSEFSNDKKNGAATWEFADLVKIVGQDNLQNLRVEIVYSAHLNDKAVVSSSAAKEQTVNNNKVSVTFSRNPNQEGGGQPEDTTPEDYVFVFTYDVLNNKVKEDGKTALKDATFEIYKDSVTENNKVKLVQDGTEKRIIESKEVEVDVYRLATPEDENTVTQIVTTEKGYFLVKGVDDGKYIIHEAKAPDGYSTAADAEATITATHKETDNEETTADLVTLTRSTGDVNTIVNKTNSELPETGGIGTAIFYTLGGLMAIGSSVVLFGKRVFGR